MAELRIGCLAMAVLVVGTLIYVGIESNREDPAAEALANRAVIRIGNGIGWDHIEVKEAKYHSYTLKLVYRAPGPDNIFTVIEDTRKIARAILGELVASGHNPSSDGTFLWVWAQVQAGRGETGAQLVRIYGHTEYNFDNDQLEFKPWKP